MLRIVNAPPLRSAAAAAARAAPAAAARYATSPLASPSPVALSSEKHAAPAGSSGASHAPVLVLHGLFGSKQNWRSLAKGMAQRLGRDILTVDLRNHGHSPHRRECSYEDMAVDVKAFIEEQEKLHECILVGHSMGGKVAMAVALVGCDPISKLAVVDISPAVGKISPEFQAYIHAMQEIQDARVHSRKEADQLLQKTEPDLGIRQFLLTNLDRASPSDPYHFRVPLPFLQNAIDEIGAFPYEPGERVFDRPSLFLKG
ncbi:hypothetical protein JCM8202_001914, partial [Rhodotorula sphaerocarpa]